MGYPTKSLSDILRYKFEIEKSYSPEFYVFILYKSEHKHFQRYILDNFNLFDRYSNNVVFFLLDYPEDWFTNHRRNDHFERYGQNYQYQINDKEIDTVLKHFNITEFQLPLVITFKSLQSYKSSVFSLAPIQDNAFELNGFFQALFTRMMENEDYYSRCKAVRERFPYLPAVILENPNRDRMYEVFERIMQAIELIDEEAIEQYPELASVRKLLVTILDSFLESKAIFKEKIASLEKLLVDNDDEKLENEIEQLRQEVDNEVYEMQKKITYTVKPLEKLLSPGNHYFMRLFEEQSLSMIHSALTTEDLVKRSNISNYDYSLCAVGFWKALEVELNIVIADAIRYMNDYINYIPSNGRTLRKDSLYVNGKRSNGAITPINVNDYRGEKLQSLMFGPLIQLLDYAEGNRYKEILEEVTPQLKTLQKQQQYKMELLRDLKKIVFEYRNKGSHTSSLSLEDLQNVKDILLKPNGLFHRIAKIKNYLLEQSSKKVAKK